MYRTLVLMGALIGTAAAAAPVDVPDEVADGMYITLEEVRANAAATFDAFAGAGADAVSREKFVNTTLPSDIVPSTPDRTLLRKLFGNLDANADGTLSRSEWNQRIERDLSFADQNGDGRVTLRGLSNARANMSVGEALGMAF